MARKSFPNPIAIYTSYFAFTTLTKSDVASHKRAPFAFPETKVPCDIFTLDDHMAYTAFAEDHGPLNLAYTFRACVFIHSHLNDARKKEVPLVLYCSPEPKIKSNIALMVALYWLIVEHESPWTAFMPVASMEVMPFRDAGAGHFDFALSAQDIINGLHKALELKLLDLSDFDVKFYEYYETPANGDLNILGPFIPFASPIEQAWVAETRRRAKEPGARSPPTCASLSSLSKAFQRVLDVFQDEKVGVVVRLNDELRHFTNRGMEHVELYFDDGSNPSDEIVRNFIRLAEEVIENRGQKVAVHCKAGLGRTGVLIGAYFIYKYQFSAQEVMGFMRIVRPGMIVGPQQQYMVENQMKWAGWAARDALLREIAEQSGGGAYTPIFTPSSETGVPLVTSGSLTPPPSATMSTFASAAAQIQEPRVATVERSMTRAQTIPRPTAARSVIDKRGDANGQPRKSIPRVKSSTLMDVDSAPVARTPSPDPAASRGIKRPAGKTTNTGTATTPRQLQAPDGALSRSSSVISVESQDDRPTKRHMLRSPLSIHSPIGTPPPMPLSSQPASDIVLVDHSPKSSTESKIPSRLRKMPSASTPTTARKLSAPLAPTSHAGEAVSAPSRIHAIASPISGSSTPKSAIPPRRTFLTSRQLPMPLRDLTSAPQAVVRPRTPAATSKIPQPPPKAVTRKPSTLSPGIRTPTARAKQVVSSLTPPKFGLGLLGIGKGSTVPPVQSG